MMTLIRRRLTFAALTIGRSCVAIQRSYVPPSLFIPPILSKSGNNNIHLTRHILPSISYHTEINVTPKSKSYQSHMLMSTINHQNDDVLEISPATNTYHSNEQDDDEEDDDDINSVSNNNDDDTNTSQSTILLNALTKSVQSALNNISKKTTSLQRELDKAQKLEETMHRANLIVSNLYRLPPGTTTAEVEDWDNDGKVVELVLNTKEYSSACEESDALFAMARKMKRGSIVVEELLQKSLEGEEILKDAMLDLNSMTQMIDEGTLILIQERLERSSKKTGFKSPIRDESTNNEATQKSLSNNNRSNKRKNDKSGGGTKPNPRVLTSPSGHRVLVGRNRRDNEAISLHLSKPTDVWMHSRGCPGAHVLLCCRRGSPDITDDDLQFAADLAAFYSDARTERKSPITTCSPKHITKPRGAPLGAVSIRQEGKTLVGRPDNVSNDLKDAREKSGAAWDEMGYRKLGTRSKNKKKTAEVEKKRQEKNREDAQAKNKRRQRKEEQDWY